MSARIEKLIDRFVSWWLHRCKHRGEHVAADIAEGAFAKQDMQVQYCRRCGAVRFHNSWGPFPWRTPDPAWFPQHGGEA
ncbi:MAG TPA: hypothetical protein VHM19_23150 [Polyangiales bacterium]|jgi:hypothetical protein|nr:hypothetical protein [Polyangiales bacterium]